MYMQTEINQLTVQLTEEQTKKFLSCFVAEAFQIVKKRKLEQREREEKQMKCSSQ